MIGARTKRRFGRVATEGLQKEGCGNHQQKVRCRITRRGNCRMLYERSSEQMHVIDVSARGRNTKRKVRKVLIKTTIHFKLARLPLLFMQRKGLVGSVLRNPALEVSFPKPAGVLPVTSLPWPPQS